MLNQLQRLGKVLIFPICVLPFAALLNRLGAIGTDPTLFSKYSVGYWIGFIINAPGGAVFNTTNLSLIFAVGVAFGFSKDNRGEAALVGALGFIILKTFLADKGISWLMYHNVDKTLHDGYGNSFSKLLYILKTDPDTKVTSANYQLDTGVFGGITIGILAAVLYNKFRCIVLPPYLAFFGGRRFIPMIVILAMFPLAFLFAAIWPWCQYGLQGLGTWIGSTKSAASAAGVLYGIVNRLLQPFGLHHIINIFLWFQLPVTGKTLNDIAQFGWQNAPNVTINGDITAFAHGLVGSGLWQTGFFPIFLGGLPGSAIAMWYCAKKSKRKETFAFLVGVAFVAFLTGIDEPLAFAFIFAAPLLWIVHAIFTGIICGLTLAMGIRSGFGFSAGFIDYAISFWRSWQFSWYAPKISWSPSWLANPLWIFPLSVGAFSVYFFSFTSLIKKFNIITPGRADDDPVGTAVSPQHSGLTVHSKKNKKQKAIAKYELLASEIIAAIDADNIIEISNCTTRLRMQLKDNSNIDEKRIKAAGAYNIIKLGKSATQIVIGNDVEHVANKMQEQLNIYHKTNNSNDAKFKN